MSQGQNLWKTTRRRRRAPASRRSGRFVCLTVACHPELTRVGERAVLGELDAEQCVRVSRIEPLFAQPQSSHAAPLADQSLSRSHFELRSAGDGDERCLVIDARRARVAIDGVDLRGERRVTRRELDAGLLLELSETTALLLHLTGSLRQHPIDGIIGCSDAIAEVRRQVTRVAKTSLPVLIRGQSGTGKECVARALHALGPRASAPFVAVNMATLTEGTAPSVLFGHVKGAFTGAQRTHRGVLEQADGGTLFLDEIADTPAAVQPMLLRAIETGKIRPVGSESDISLDLRVLAATDAPLEQAKSGSFRTALLHRLAGYVIRVPSLRERRDDVPRLFVHFLRQELDAVGELEWLERPPDAEAAVDTLVIAQLLRSELEGNVRQLRNIVRQAVVSGRDDEQLTIPVTPVECSAPCRESAAAAGPGTGPAENAKPANRSGELSELVSAYEAAVIGDALARCGNNCAMAARMLQTPRRTLADKIKQYGLNPQSARKTERGR